MKKILLILIVLTSARWVQGQDTLTISQPEFVEKVIQNNSTGKIAEKQAAMAKADFQQSNALYLPTISASYTAMVTNNPLMAFGSKLNQEILTQQDFNPELLNNPDDVQNYASEILILQPLLNLDGIYERNAARIQHEAYQLKAERTKEYLALEATKLYMQLQLAYEAVKVINRAHNTASEAVDMVADYYEQGMVQKADLLDARVRMNEVKSQLQYARSNVQNTSDQLLVLMGETPGSSTLLPQSGAPVDYDIATYSGILPENRKDLMAMSRAVDGYESMLKSSKMKFIPRINAFGSFQVYDNEALQFGASGYLVGAKASWDIFNGYSKIAKTHKARLEMEKAKIEQEGYISQQQAELIKANRMLADAKNKVDLFQLAFEQAAESYKVRKDRFEQGLEKTVDLLMTESQMYHKELQLQQAVFEYNFAKEYLHFLTKE